MVTPSFLRRRLGHAAALLARFRESRSGVSALEFALVLPILMLLFCGTLDITDGVTINRKVTRTSDTLADLVGQVSSLNNAEMKNVLDISAAIMLPYSAKPLTLMVTGVTIDANGKATVAWSDARNRTALSKGAKVTLPTGLSTPSTFLVMTEVTYRYEPTIGYVMTGAFTLKDTAYVKPRTGASITRTTS